MRVIPGAQKQDAVDVSRETCPLCLEPWHGGPRLFQGVDQLWRATCADDKACYLAWWRHNPVLIGHRWYGPPEVAP